MTISISPCEPRPLIFPASNADNELPSTELLLRFSTRQILTGNESEDLEKPDITDCWLTIILEATTYFLQHEKDSVMSFTEARDTLFSVVKRTRYKFNENLAA
jgi:hypothetical protein